MTVLSDPLIEKAVAVFIKLVVNTDANRIMLPAQNDAKIVVSPVTGKIAFMKISKNTVEIIAPEIRNIHHPLQSGVR